MTTSDLRTELIRLTGNDSIAVTFNANLRRYKVTFYDAQRRMHCLIADKRKGSYRVWSSTDVLNVATGSSLTHLLAEAIA